MEIERELFHLIKNSRILSLTVYEISSGDTDFTPEQRRLFLFFYSW